MTYRLQRSIQKNVVLYALSGEIDRESASQLEELLAAESAAEIVLDLNDVTIVRRAAVTFLARIESTHIRITNCPEYVRSWIAAERDAQP